MATELITLTTVTPEDADRFIIADNSDSSNPKAVLGSQLVRTSGDQTVAGNKTYSDDIQLADTSGTSSSFRILDDGGVDYFRLLGLSSSTERRVEFRVARANSSSMTLSPRIAITSGTGLSNPDNAITITDATLNVDRGIQFGPLPTTTGRVPASNTLNDYEEGTFTPTSGTSPAATNVGGRYTKIGNKVYVEGYIEWIITTSTATVSIGGLPFAPNETINSNSLDIPSGLFQTGTSFSTFQTGDTGHGFIHTDEFLNRFSLQTAGGSALRSNNLSGEFLRFSATYITDA